MSSQWLWVFTLRFCSSETRQARISRALMFTLSVSCMAVWEPVGGEDTAVTDQSDINIEQWMMDGGRFALKTKFSGYRWWCHPRTNFVHTYIFTVRADHTSDSSLRLNLNELCPLRMSYSHIWSESDFNDTALWLSGAITLSCMFMFTNKPHDVCWLTAADALIDHQAHELDPADARRAYRTLIRQLSGKPRNSYQSTISTQRRLVFLITTRTLPLLRTTGPRLLGGLRAKLRNKGA